LTDILNCLMVAVVTILMGLFAWESTLLVDEQKRKGRNNDRK